MKIWKYELKTVGCAHLAEIEMPKGAKILSALVQFGEIVIWAMVDPAAPNVNRVVEIVGTGWEVPERALLAPFIGSVMLEGGHLVFHLFDLGERE
jgi:hypothetical protein